MLCPFIRTLGILILGKETENRNMEYQAWHSRSQREGETRALGEQDGGGVVKEDASARCGGMPAICNPGTWQAKAEIL